MRQKRFSGWLKVTAFFTVIIFVWDQTILAAQTNLYDQYASRPVQAETQVSSASSAHLPVSRVSSTAFDFLAAQSMPLSSAGNTTGNIPPSDLGKTYGPDGKLRQEIASDGTTIHYVYEGESIQNEINNANAGDVVYLHRGIYREYLTLKNGINLKGEDSRRTIISGNNQPQTNIITVLGNNRIENLTITGGGPYAGYPASAIRIQADHVKIRNNRFVDNRDYGIYVWSGTDLLIEENFFQGNHLAIQLPKAGTLIRYNTFIANNIAVNILNGGTPVVENNIFTNSTFQSIYEFCWGRTPSRGYATVQNNTFFNNVEHGTYYGSATPPAVAEERGGNLVTDPQFTNATAGDYSIKTTSSSYGRGAFLPLGLAHALDRVSDLDADYSITPILNGQFVTGYRVLYEEGSIEEFYNNGTQVLDTTPPIIEFLPAVTVTNQSIYELRYKIDSVERTETRMLTEGSNVLTVQSRDIFGNKAEAFFDVILDTHPPLTALRINNGDAETNNLTVRLDVNAQDAVSLKDIRFSTDNGLQWTDWTAFVPSKVMTLPAGEGFKTITCQVRDQAGNIAAASSTIRYVFPIQFLSDQRTTDPNYVLRYTIQGAEHQESWELQPGENRLMVETIVGNLPAFAAYAVTLDQPEIALPPMPAIPTLPQDLMTMTAANGLILKYANASLVAIENPNSYTLYLPQFDAAQNLVSGLLVFSNGNKLLYQNGKAVYGVNSQGERTVYHSNGRIAYVQTADNKKIKFNYELNDSGQVLSMLVAEEDGTTSRYSSNGKPLWVKKTDGTAILYQNGFLETYRDEAGNIFHYEIATLRQGTDVSGYRSVLSSVTWSATNEIIPISTIQRDPDYYPSIKDTLQDKLTVSIEYDISGVMKETVSGKGEVLRLQNGLPVSYASQSGALFHVQTQLAADHSLLSVSVSEEGESQIEQVYDATGQLSAVRLKGGTSFRVTAGTLADIRLDDGSLLMNLIWNGQNLTGFKRFYPDGSQEVYQNFQLIERTNASGNKTTYVNFLGAQRPDTITTNDGKVYRVIKFLNAEGLTSQLTELLRIDLPDGAWIEFNNGKPIRYGQYKTVQLDLTEVPVLPDGKFFVPKVTLQDAELRSLTVDQDGFIYSGEILFNDGMQYFIENNQVVKQITPSGQFVEFSSTLPEPVQTPAAILPEPLTPTETAYRNDLIETQLDYFLNGKGIHTPTGLPVDNYNGLNEQQADYSQATLIGFWAEILAAIATGEYQTSKISRIQAFEKLNALLAVYQEIQEQVGWNGMVAFFTIAPTIEPVLDGEGHPTGMTRLVYKYQRRFNEVGLGDNVNLSVSLASVIGALQGLTLDAGMAVYRDQILNRSNAILTAQEPGYAAFYDADAHLFYQAYRFQGDFVGHMDRVFDEFRPGLAWLVSRFPQYQDAFYNLSVTLRNYRSSDGAEWNIASPYDGGAFQMFWPLIHVDETKYPELEPALRNFLYAQAEFVQRNNIPGLLSAGDNPGQGYEGKIGLPDAAEADDIRYTNIGSIYGIASAFGLAPHYTLQFLKNLEAAFPQIRTSDGFIDAIKMQTVTKTDPGTGQSIQVQEPVFSTQYFGVDQASFILSLLKTSQTYFQNYLEEENLKTRFDSVYQSIKLNLSPPASGMLPTPPNFHQAMASLYTGSASLPDGASAGLVKVANFIPTLSDPEYGIGSVFNYLTAAGNFHHTEIEFNEGDALRRMSLQEYLLLPGRSALGRSLLESYQFSIYELSGNSQGDFYTPGAGFCRNMPVSDPQVGTVRHVIFDAKYRYAPVGLWNRYHALDLGPYDFLSIPVRVGEDTPEKIRLKFEFKGTGNIFVTEPLKHGWQYVHIPVSKPTDGMMYELATVIQSTDGSEVSGNIYLGPLSAFKVRTSDRLDWVSMLGTNAPALQQIILNKIASSSASGNLRTAIETLDHFTIDSDGKLISGTLNRADGGIQYFQDGKLVKWIFKNGRTVLFENGLASFVIDLARGKLETGRFYYDENLRGEIRSFHIQDNDRRRVFGPDGKLQKMIQDGNMVAYENGKISSITTSAGTFSDLEFADDGGLLRAILTLKDGTVMTIDQTQEQYVDYPNGGPRVIYQNGAIKSIVWDENNRLDVLSYERDLDGQITGTTVHFRYSEWVYGTTQVHEGTCSLAELLFGNWFSHYVSDVKPYFLSKSSNVLSLAEGMGGFQVGALKPGEFIWGAGNASEASCKFLYQDTTSQMGLYIMNRNHPVSLIDYNLLQISIHPGLDVTWEQPFVVKIKNGNTLFTYETSGGRFLWIPLPVLSAEETEITVEPVPTEEGIGKQGSFTVTDLEFISLKRMSGPHSFWETQSGMTAQEISTLKIESDHLTAVGAEIASNTPPDYAVLAEWFDAPALLYQTGDGQHPGDITYFQRFDGSRVDLDGENVSRVTLPDGTVHEYLPAENSSQTTVQGSSSANSAVGNLDYRYGALRKITQSDGKIYEFSYEFDGQGNEITVIKDDLTGDLRKFQGGKLLQSISAAGITTTYSYLDEALIGAELFYKNRVLQSTSYKFSDDETQVTDHDGTTWYYDKNGNLKKHLTRDGYLYAYLDYSVVPQNPLAVAHDYKWTHVFNAADLRAVTWVGYESRDGFRIKKGDDGLMEIDTPSGDKAVNVVLDDDRKIKSGQIQFDNGLILEIENYLPVRGRLADGAFFSANFPANDFQITILQDQTGSYTGSMFQSEGTYYSYDAYGYLLKIDSPNGESWQFTYQADTSGNLTGYNLLHHKQIDFNGVPFPKALTLEAGNTIVMRDPDAIIGKREGSPGFLISTYDESLNQWKVLSGQFASTGDRILLKNFLINLKPGQYVAMAVKDPYFSSAGNEILSLLEGIGAGNVRNASAANQTWYLFGNEYLKKGEGCEQTGGSSFSSATESAVYTSLSGITDPVFHGMHLILSVPEGAADAYSAFLKAYEPNKPGGDLEKITVYDSQNQIVYSENLSGVRTFYDRGKPRETFASDGELLYVHEYGCPDSGCANPNDLYLVKVTLVKARADFEAEAAKSRQQIAQVKFDALRQLAEQEEVAQANIKQEVASALAALDAYIHQLESQRFQNVKVCKSVFLGFGRKCHEERYEVPGVVAMINATRNQKAQLLEQIQPEQIATIPLLIAQKKSEIENATAQKITDLAAQEQAVFHDILEREVAPVLADIYRRLLGRDPSDAEVDTEIARFGAMEAIDLSRTINEIRNSPEFLNRTNEKAAMISQVQTFLSQYLAAANDPTARATLVQSLRLDPSEAVDLNQEDVTAILQWLGSRDLHFGQSAFLSLKEMLSSRGIHVPMTTLGRESVLVDILTGTINRFAEGDLLISVFAMERAAKIHGADITGVRYSLADLRSLYASACPALQIDENAACGLRVIVHIGKEHFAVITGVTPTAVSYFETNQGADGTLVHVTLPQFSKSWDAGDGTGHLVVFKDQSITTKRLDDKTAMRVRGSFFPLLIFWFTIASVALTVASVVVSFISPTFGKIIGYAAMVAGIVAIAASVVNFAVQGFSMALSSIQHAGLLQSIQNGFTSLGNTIWEGVSHAGQFLKQGFTFFTDMVTGNFGALGAGITNIGNYVVDGIKIMFDPAGALVPQTLTLGQTIGRTMIAAAINMPVSKGLEGLGIESTMARLAGAFVSGGVIGLGGGMSEFLRSGMQMYLLQGVSEMGLKLDLPPPITSAISLGVTASLAGLFDPAFNLRTELPGIFPRFTQQLTLGGLELVGRSLGLDPRITALIGYPIAASIGHIVNSALSPGTFSILDSLKEALLSRETLGGFVSMGAYWLADVLDVNPLLISLGLRGIVGGIEGLTNQTSSGNAITRFFGGIAGALQESIKNVLTLGGEGATEYQKSLYLMQLVSLASKIRDGGDIFDVFEMYAVQILGRDTVESIYATGQNIEDYFRARQAAQDFTVRQLEDGTIVHEYTVGNNKFVLNEDETQILARQFGSHTESGQYRMDEQGRYVMVNGEMTFTNGTESMTLTVRDAQVVNVDMIDAQGNAVSFFGTETQPLVLVDNPNGSFTIQSGVARNWDTGDTAYYSAGQVSAVQQTLFIDYQTDLGDTAAGSIQFVEHFDGVNISGGYEIHMDPGFQQHLLDGDPVAMRNVAETLIDNQRITDLPDTHRSLLEDLNITRHEIANQADAVVDRIFDYIKPETDSLLEDILLFPQTASVELLRSVVKGFIDAIRIGDRLDNMWDDATGAWRDINDGNLSDAGKKILSLGLNTATELFRALDIVLIGGVVKTVVGAGVTAVKTGIADLVGKLLRRQGDVAADSLLTRLFRNNGLKGEFLSEANNIDDVAEAYSRRYIGVDDVTDINITRQGQEVNADYLVRRPGHEIPWDPFEAVTEKGVRDSFNVVDGDPLVRVFVPSSSNPTGKGYWITRRSVIEGKSPAEIKQILSLPQEPTHVADVVFGSTDTVFIRDGIAGSNAYGVGGGHQYEIISELKDDWFKRLREIGDIFND